MNHTFECMSSTSAERSLGHFITQMAYKIKSSQKWSEDLTQAQDMIVHIENGSFNYLALNRNPCVNGKSITRSSSLLCVMYYSSKRAKSL